MQRLKVCFVQPVQSPYWTERFSVLAKRPDFDVNLFIEKSSLSHRPGWEPQTIPGVNIQVLGSQVIGVTNVGADLGYVVKGIRSIPWRLTYRLHLLRPDIVIVCNAVQLLFSLPIKWLFGMRISLIVEDTPHSTRNLKGLRRTLKRKIYQLADAYFPFSNDAQRFLADFGISKQQVHQSSWSLDMTVFRPSDTAVMVRGVPSEHKKKTVLFVGQLVPGKGILNLLEGWKQLDKGVRDSSRLLVVGDGPQRDSVVKYIEDNNLEGVYVLGQRPYSEVRQLYQNSDLFVLPTLQDLFSLTVLEAMACGCAVITTVFNGARELINDGCGWIIDPTRSGALSSVLKTALSQDTNLRAMGEIARQRVVAMDNAMVMEQFAKSLLRISKYG